MSARTRRRRNDHGLTLVELMVSITISALIMGVLASAAVTFFQHSSDNNNNYDDQSSVQSLQAFFTADAQSATSVVLNDPAPCGSSTTAITTFSWADAGTTATASWTVEQSANLRTLVRRRCTNGTVVERTDVAGVTGTPTVTCSPSCASFTTVTIGGTAQHGATFGVTGTRRTSVS